MPNTKNKINLSKLKLAYSEGGKTVDEDEKRRFVKKLELMSKKYGGVTPEDFLSIMLKENSIVDGELLVDQWSGNPTNDRGGRARGLIQFVPTTALGIMGYSKQEIDAMPDEKKDRLSKEWQDDLSNKTPTEQLDFVDQYFAGMNGGRKSIKNYEDLYLSVFQPAAVGKGDDFVIAEKGTTKYKSNEGVDQIGSDGKKDGKITVGDFKAYAGKNLPVDTTDYFTRVSNENYAKGHPQPNKIFIKEENVKQDNGKFRTTFIAPDGIESTEVTDSPVSVKNVLGDTYLSDSKGKNYKVNENGVGYSKKSVTDSEIYDSKLKVIKEKVKSGEDLSSEDLYMAKRIHKIQQEQFDDAILYKETNKTEGRFEDNWKNEGAPDDVSWFSPEYNMYGPENVKRLRVKKDVNEVDFNKNVLIPDIKRKKEKAFKQKTDNINNLRKVSLDMSLSPEDQSKALGDYEKEKELFNTYSKQYAKDMESLNRPSVGMQSKKDIQHDRYSNVHSRLDKDAFGFLKTIEENMEYVYPETAVPEEKAEIDTDSPGGGGSDAARLAEEKRLAVESKRSGDNAYIDSRVGLTKEQEDAALKYYDLPAIQKSIDLDASLLEDLKNRAPIDDSVQEQEEDVLGNALGYGSDIARGIIGLSGATEKLPEYRKGDAFNEYVSDARQFKNQGLTALEESVRKQRGERAYGYDVANIRNMGQGAGATLAAMGGAADRLQDRYAEVGLEDAALKRQGRSEFARAALSDEQINRQQFEDKFTVSMANKEAGAGLVRDAYTNINERYDYNKQYGKGSQYSQHMQELNQSMKLNRELLKRGEESRIDEAIRRTQGNITKSKSDYKEGKRLNDINKAK